MQSHSDVELILAAVLDQVFVAANSAGLQSFRAELFIFIRHEMNAQWEVVDEGSLATQVEDADFRVGNTTTEARLRVRLVFTVAITKTRKITLD